MTRRPHDPASRSRGLGRGNASLHDSLGVIMTRCWLVVGSLLHDKNRHCLNQSLVFPFVLPISTVDATNKKGDEMTNSFLVTNSSSFDSSSDPGRSLFEVASSGEPRQPGPWPFERSSFGYICISMHICGSMLCFCFSDGSPLSVLQSTQPIQA